MRATAAWVVGPRQVVLRDEPLRPPGPDEVAVRALFSGVSRGTERLVLEGRVPPELADRMRAPFQQGAFPWPVKYGYCSVGVVEGGALPAGTTGFCLHPHQDRYTVPAAAFVPLPDGLPPGRAVLAANQETALNAVWDAGVGPGDRVAVVGGGVVGAAIARLCGRIPGASVVLVDVLPERAALARALGVSFATPDAAPAEQDVVFHTSAQPAGLATAIALAGDEARVMELSWYGAGTVPAPLGGAFHARRLQLRCSQVGQLPTERRPRWDYRRRLVAALALLRDDALDALVDAEVPFESLPEALARVAEGPGGPLCLRVSYGGP